MVTGCAPKTAPLPPAVTSPKFPDFVQPQPPPGLGTPAALERHHIAWEWLQAGDLRAAERNFASALRQAATFYPAEVGLGYVALAAKKHKDSLLHFDRAVVANPRYAPALAGRAEALLGMGEVDEAVASIEAALTADPGLGVLRSRLEVLRFRNQQEDIGNARKLAAAGRLDEARAAYRTLVDASPASAFLLRELAEVERKAGNIEPAAGLRAQGSRARTRGRSRADPAGDLYEAQGDVAKALEALSAAAALQPGEVLPERIAALRSRVAFEAMPPEYRSIESSPAVTRAQLAALLAVRLDDLLVKARRVSAVVITDTRGSWAASHILSVARSGVMEVYPNHTFQPEQIVRRADLADAAGRVLEIIAARSPQLAASWRNSGQRKFADVGPRHLSYAAVSLVVEAGVMTTRENGAFDLTPPVTGAEAVAALVKLQELGGRTGP